MNDTELKSNVDQAKKKLDAHTVETVQWHFHPSTGCPFWLQKAKEFKFNPLKEVKAFDDLKKFPLFEDEWLRGGPVRRWLPQAVGFGGGWRVGKTPMESFGCSRRFGES